MKKQQNLSYDLLRGKELYLDNKCCSNCCTIFTCLFLNLLLWAGIIIFCELFYTRVALMFMVFGSIYILFIYFEIHSLKLYHYLSTTYDDIYYTVEKIIQGKPIISISCECYHKVKTGGRDGYYVKVVTFRKSYEIPYYSSRDCSGLLILNNYTKNIKCKCLFKLNIKKRIFFADDDTFSD